MQNMKKSEGASVPSKDALAKFLSGNREQRVEYHCEVLLNLSSTLLASRTVEEISEAEHFVETHYQDLTDVVDALNVAIEGKWSLNCVGFKDGKKHEYFAVQTRLIVARIHRMMQSPTCGETLGDIDHLIAWAESQAGKSIETAIEAYIDFIFPGRLDDLMVLLDLGVTGLLQRILGGLYTTILPAAEPYFQKILETPGLLELLAVGVKELERKAKSEAARKAASSGRIALREAKAFAIRKYEAGKWHSPHEASISMCQEVADIAGRHMAKDRGHLTVYAWLLAHDKKKTK